jgi:hypothetical protein
VRLASYAPLLARVDATQWEPDLIYFDADTVLPTASYYVQQMFAAERGTDLREVRVVGADPVPVTLPFAGSARVRSEGAAFVLTDIVLDGAATPPVATDAGGAVVTLGAIDPSSAVLELTATRTSGAKGIALQLGGEGAESYIELAVPNWTGKETVVNRYDDGIGNDDNGAFPWRSLRTGEPMRIRVELDGARVRAWVDGDLLHDYEQDLRPEHRVVVGVASREGRTGEEYVVRVVNATDETRVATVALPTSADVTGRVTALAGAGPDEGASFAPSPVRPVSRDVSGTAGAVVLDVPPWSLSVAVLDPIA